ncbi:MAG: SEL1-like repeat protein [Alphaproteobacteria bacterium]|nr:SEL1-like repeat protein [Alphaproteobacteria bacterium]
MITFRYGPAQRLSDPYMKDAFDACENDAFERAFSLFQKSAELGNHAAQTCLAVMMINGNGITQDPQTGIAMLEMLVHTQVAEAQSVLGELYYCGFYLPMDEVKAHGLFEKAARIRDPDALFFLGQIYGRGEGVDVDTQKAVTYLEAAHKAGHPTALLYQASLTIFEDVQEDKIRESLSVLIYEAEEGSSFAAYLLYEHYDKGTHFVQQDKISALRWLERAAAQGYARALFELGHIYLEEKAYDKALFYLEQAAAQNHLGALHTLGVLYKQGGEVPFDPERACTYLEKAASQGHALAKYSLGHYYYYQDPPLFEKAHFWLERACEQDQPDAFYLLAQMTERGEHVAEDPEKALSLYEKAAHLGDAHAHFILAKRLLWSKTALSDEARKKGFSHLEQAAALGFDHALLSLGVEFGEGTLVPLDREKAFSLLIEAVHKKVDGAFFQLTYLLDNDRFPGEEEALPLDELERLAQTDANTQFMLANKYAWADDLPQDDEKAFMLYTKAADQGHLKALNALGYFYRHGKGCPPSHAQTFACYERAANGGYLMAMRNLAWCYEKGIGTDQDFEKALFWYKRGQSLGDIRCYADLGRFYEYGYGVPQDHSTAFSLYQKGAALGEGFCTLFLGISFEDGIGIACDPARARACYEEALAYEIATAYVRLAGLYENGTGVDQDLEKAFELYAKAAEDFDDDEAQYGLAYAYHHGWGVAQDIPLAHRWYKEAAEKGHTAAALSLGELFYYGHLGEVNFEEAAFWYGQAAANENAAAQYSLAHLYFEGYGVSHDDEKAFSLASVSAHRGDTSALALLGLMHEEGRGTKKDLHEALRHYELSAAQDDGLGLYYLGRFYDQQQHYSQALKWYNKAGEQHQVNALERLGFFYLFGIGVTKNPSEAYAYYLQAAEAGSKESQRLIAHFLLRGKGTPRNAAQAHYWMAQSLQRTPSFQGKFHHLRFKALFMVQKLLGHFR